MTDNFADHPLSITELRSDKSQNAADWSPRDALISALRDLDAGKIKPDALVVCYRKKDSDGAVETSWYSASPDLHTSLGMLARVMHRMQELGSS